MIHVLGYGALVINLSSMAMKQVLYLRVLSLIANALYIVYGVLLNAPPFIVGCSVAVMIHGWHIFRLVVPKESSV